MILALALASNFRSERYLAWAKQQLQQFGDVQWADTYRIPCRDGIGADYDNTACLIKLSAVQKQQFQCYLTQQLNTASHHDFIENIKQYLHLLEQRTGRKRPSHQISLDIDLIAWGESLTTMQFNPKKLPLPLDVVIPLQEIWNFTIS